MFVRRQAHWNRLRDFEAEHMFVVMGGAWRETMSPVWIDLESAHKVPLHKPLRPGLNPRFLEHLPLGSLNQRLVQSIDRAGHRLPEAGARRTLEEEDLQL